MKKSLLAAAAFLLLSTAAPAGAQGKFVRLGTDPALDGPPSLDITYLDVARVGKDLEIRIGIDNILPAIRSVPEVPGIEWVFDVSGRTFVAEAVPGISPTFYLFEELDGTFRQLPNPTGTYEVADGYASVIIPLKVLGARPGTKISGHGPTGTDDVDAHIHAGPQTIYPDSMATTKDYVVPK